MTTALVIRDMTPRQFEKRLKKGITDIDLDVEIKAMEKVKKKTFDQNLILGELRRLRVWRSDSIEWVGWLEQAEDIWHFAHDVIEIGTEIELADGKTVIRDRAKGYLWTPFAGTWSEFCQTVLNMPPEEARLRERVWEEFVVKQEIPKRLLMTGRRSCLKRAVHFARLLREVGDGERLDELHNQLFSLDKKHRPATFRELNDWITEEHQKIKTEATFHKPWVILDYEEEEKRGKLVGKVYLRMAGEKVELGELKFNEPPDKLLDEFERGRELVRKRLGRKARDEQELLEVL